MWLLALSTAWAADRPDILYVLTDDLDYATLHELPELVDLVGGTRFDQAFVSVSLCCPSRATSLTGNYAHNTGVFVNSGPHGGFDRFHEGPEQNTIATVLQAAGYRTGLFGKYLNRYPNGAPDDFVPPGWSTWDAAMGTQGYQEYDYKLNVDGKVVQHGHTSDDYLPDVLIADAGRFLDTAGNTPVFAWITPFPPHLPATAAPRYAGHFATLRAPRTPNWDEADVSDKPSFLQLLPRLDTHARHRIDDVYRRRADSMLVIEDLVRMLLTTQARRGRLDHTWLVFGSDNGFHLGNHRMPPGKETAYEEDIRVPMIVRGPGVAAGGEVHAMVVNTDLAPTFAAMAGVPYTPGCDGRSWLPWLTGPTPTSWRQAFLLERGDHQEEEIAKSKKKLPHPALEGIRSARWMYAEYTDGEKELYDLVADPAELENLAGMGRAAERALAAWLGTLRSCAGDACRAAEDTPPPGVAVP